MRAIVIACLLALAPAAPAAAKLHWFKAPWSSSAEGETSCVIDTRKARCDVENPAWTVGDRDGCRLEDYGRGVEVRSRSRRGFLTCASDSVLGATKVLRVGGSIKERGMRCTAHRRWITCTNGRRHGFRVGPGTRDLF